MAEPWVEDWAAIGTLPLGDVRRNARIRQVIAGLCERPAGTITQVFEQPGEAKAVYRLLARSSQWQAPLAQALRQGCLARVAKQNLILAIQDTTHLDFAASPVNGEGGFWLHSLLAATPDGVPLGVLHQRFWQRDPTTTGVRHQRRQRSLPEKESQRWLDALEGVGGDDWPASTHVIVVGDRENDIFEYFAAPRPVACDLLVRGAHPLSSRCELRRVAGPEGNLWQAVAATAVADERLVVLPRRPERSLRQARLQLRFRPVRVRPPKHGPRPEPASVTLWVVAVEETQPPAGETPLSWVLLTTRPVDSVDRAWECVDFYCRRWLIERFHYTLKSGCKIEASQLRDAAALRALTTLFCYVAWRLLWLTYLGRTLPNELATLAFTTLEWQTLLRLRFPKRDWSTPPTLGETVALVARLGGHLGRRGDGPPGVKVLWRGLTRLQDIVIGVLLVTDPSHRDVGNA